MTILVACGLSREARIVTGPNVIAVAGGGDATRLEAELEAHAGAARIVLSSGLCGALDPALKVGDLVVGWLAPVPQPSCPPSRVSTTSASSSTINEVVDTREDAGMTGWFAAKPSDNCISYNEGKALLAVLRARLPEARFGAVAGVDRIVATAEAKSDLRAATGAIAADMESHVAARVARRHGLPFAIVRAVSDAADLSLPPAALVGMRPDGGMALGAVLRALAQNPAQVPALIATGVNAERAFRALLRGHRRLRAGDLHAHLVDVV